MTAPRANADDARSYGQVCPIARTLDVLGDRWTLLIVRDLFLGRTRYQEFMEGSPGIPARMLSDRLKKLVRHQLIERVIYSEHPLRAEYHLTELGRSLEPVIIALASWGLDHRLNAGEQRRVREGLRARGISV